MQHKRKTGPRKAKPIPEHITEAEYTDLLKVIPGIHHKMAVMFAWEVGLRISETTNIYPNDIDWDNQTMKIREGKGKKDRVVPLPWNFTDYHMQFLPIACSKRALETMFVKAAAASGLKEKKPKICFHSLRHGYATYCLGMGMELVEIQPLMGHSDIQTTQHYAWMNPIKPLTSWHEKVAQDG